METQRKESLLASVTRDLRAYELMTVFIPDLSEEDNQAALDKVTRYITDATGEITETLTDSPWGRRRLAYTIRSNSVDYRDGFYVVTHFSASPASITDIERELKLDTNVMRYLIVMDDPLAGEQSTGQEAAGAAEGADDSEEAMEPDASTESAPAEAVEAPATESRADAAVETDAEPQAAEADEAPATEQAQVASDETIESETAEAAEAIPDEESPAPADAPTESKED